MAAPIASTVDVATVARRLSEAVQIPTVSAEPPPPAMDDFLSWLSETYPTAHRELARIDISKHTALYRWSGSNPDLKPILLAAHYDVVPANPATLERWTHPPFSGTLSDGFVWGRGAIDDKATVVVLFEAIEELLAAGKRPKRDVYVSLGHDEEIGGDNGAAKVVKHLIDKGVLFDWTMDEGSFVLEGVVPGLDKAFASINVAEKGYLTLQLIARAEGGHSAMPPQRTAVGAIARALVRLEAAPVPGGLTGVSGEFFSELGRNFSFVKRVPFANQWLFRPILERVLSGAATTNAVLRTTTAPTMLTGAPRENLLATQATATVNFRLHPRDSIASVTQYVLDTIDDETIEVEVDQRTAKEPSATSRSDAEGFQALQQAILVAHGEQIIVPGLTVGATDSQHYAKLAPDSYRIRPFKINKSDIARLHGVDERISLENLGRGVQFFVSLLSDQ